MSRTDKTALSDTALEEIFAAGRAATPAPSEALMARILTDAEGEIARHAVASDAEPTRRGLFAGVIAALGGWPAVAGMVTATIAGVWIGFASPEQLNTLAGGVLLPAGDAALSYELEDMLPADGGLSALFEEG